MALSPGTTLGSYRIVALIGAGGMGEVYSARDSKLDRDVAIKILPESFADDPERVARFEREAKTLASLNHPHIGAIYGLQETSARTALVLELVEGPTLADRIGRGPIPFDEALPIARQIADALEAAHECGIIHRDLKPANIKIRPDGTVKVLDFGLAKALRSVGTGAGSVSASPTLTGPLMSSVGLVLGTAGYMSPEQAKGETVDKRGDVWAFGCVLYEMLTGMRAFAGEDIDHTFAAVMRNEPDFRALPEKTPSAIRRLLQRSLEKDPRHRLRDIGDAKFDLDEALVQRTPTDPAVSSVASRSRSRPAWLLVALFALGFAAALGFTGVLYIQQGQSDAGVVRFADRFPDGWTWTDQPAVDLALSPDGRYLAFAAMGANKQTLLWVRELGGLTARPLPGTEGASSPFWSPDTRSLGFFADGKLKRIGLSENLPFTVCDAPDGRSGSWGSANVIVFDRLAGPIQRVSASGGTPTNASGLDSDFTIHQAPSFLPDGRHFVYRAGQRGAASSSTASLGRPVYVAALDSPSRTRLLDADAANVVYSRGHLMFLRQNTLMAQPFDERRLVLSGEAVPIAENVRLIRPFRDSPPFGQFSASQNGVLAYQRGGSELSRLVWYDRGGKQLSVLGDPASYSDVKISPRGDQAAVSVNDPISGTHDIWLFDLARGFRNRFTFDPGQEVGAVWSPDGSRIVFNTNRNGTMDLYQKAVNRSDAEESPLLTEEFGQLPEDWSPDGEHILFSNVTSSTERTLWVLPLGDRKPRRFGRTSFFELAARFSPNGRWVAFQSNISGRDRLDSEVYVTAFPGPGEMRQVSTDGGFLPKWSPDGKEIFFLDRNRRLIAASVSAGNDLFEVRGQRTLFPTRASINVYSFDRSADGQSFLINEVVEENAVPSFVIVLNWLPDRRK
jgi:Tol biopolymer transport system component